MTARTPEEIAREIVEEALWTSHQRDHYGGYCGSTECEACMSVMQTESLISSALSRERSRADPVAEAAIRLAEEAHKTGGWGPAFAEALKKYRQAVEGRTGT